MELKLCANDESGHDQRTDKLLDDKIVKMVHTKDDASEDSDDEDGDESTLDKSRAIINSNHFLDIPDQQKAYLQ